jgi:hypothetical protein
METELLNLSLGQTSSTYISDTVNRDGKWRLIHIINDAEFATLTDGKAIAGSNSIVGDSIKQGTVLGGDFTQIKLASGIVKAYS